MMNYIWGFFLISSVICALLTGRTAELSNSVMAGASDAVGLVISILGMMVLWTGLMKIAEKSGLTSILARVFSPIIRFLFPDFPPDSPAGRALCMNITANLLGLGNAATPFGITAMNEMQKLNKNKSTATKSMIMFVVINTASLQLFPTLLCTIRQKYGSQNTLDILPCLWVSSLVALVIGVILTKLFEKTEKIK